MGVMLKDALSVGINYYPVNVIYPRALEFHGQVNGQEKLSVESMGYFVSLFKGLDGMNVNTQIIRMSPRI